MTTIIEVKDGGNSLKFEIRKMPATQAEDFVYRLIELAGKNIDFSSAQGAMDIIRAITASKHEEAKALLDELLFCCWRVTGKTAKQVSYDDLDSYITSPLSLMTLRVESAKVNFDFFSDFADWLSRVLTSFTPTVPKSEALPDSQISDPLRDGL